MKQKLKLFEVLNLITEIGGYTNPNTGEVVLEGLLNQNISYSTKYKIKSSIKQIESEKSIIDEMQQDLIKKYGTEKDGSIGIDRVIIDKDGNQQLNPNFVNFQEDWNKFLTENEKDIEFPEISLEEMKDVKTKDNYIILDKYFIIDNE